MDENSNAPELNFEVSNFFVSNPSDLESNSIDTSELKHFWETPNQEETSSIEVCSPLQFNTMVSSNNIKPDEDCIKMFVGQIPSFYDENDLLKLFEKYGKVYELRLLRDKIAGKSKGCCFITFFTRQAALAAQNALHNVKMLPGMHHPVQMKPADHDNRVERKVFIGMLSRKLSEGDIRNLFSPYGTIEECTVLRDTNNRSKGCAFVTYTSRQSAKNAIKSMHHCHIFPGCSTPMVVKFADTQKDKEIKKLNQIKNEIDHSLSSTLRKLSAESVCSLIMSNSFANQLPNCGCAGLNAQAPLLSGLISSNPLMQVSSWDHLTGTNRSLNINTPGGNCLMSQLAQSLGLTSVSEVVAMNNFLNQVDMNQQLQSTARLHSQVQPESMSFFSETNPFSDQAVRRWSMERMLMGQKQIEGPEGGNLFIYHLPQEFTDRKLAEMFLPYGRVLSAKVFIDKETNASKCFGFVSYDSANSARLAIQNLNGYQILGKKLKVEVKKHQEQPNANFISQNQCMF